MTPRKKVHDTQTDKQSAYERKLRKAGKTRMSFWINKSAAGKLRHIAKEQGVTVGEAIESLVANYDDHK